MHERNSPVDSAGESSLKKTLRFYLKLSPFVGIGLVVVAIMVASVLWIQRGAHVELTGSIQKIRTMSPEPTSTVAIIDFRVHNPSDYRFIVGNAQAFVTAPDGEEVEGQVVSDVDTRQLFEYFPLLGQRYNDSLVMRTSISPKQTADRMLAVRFEMPEGAFQQRKQLRLHIDEVDGPVSDILERVP